MMEQLAGQVIDDRYELLSVLSHGDQAALLKARDRTLEQDAIIKVLPRSLAENADIQQRFHREALAAARLNHPAILQVYDFGVYRSYPYVVLRFINGSTLRQRLDTLRANDKWISLEGAIWLVGQLAGALEYAHRQGVVHGDLRPGNIILEPMPGQKPPYRPVLTFVGLEATQEFDERVYLAPEGVQGAPTDVRSDVYSLGILLYELAVGDLPLPDNTNDKTVLRSADQSLPLPGAMRPDIPPFIEQAILKATRKKPGDRYRTAAELASALENREAGSSPERTSLLELPPSEMEYVQIQEKGKPDRSVNLKRGEITIGRGQENDIVVSDPEASRRHTRITWDGTSCFVTDLESRNGTYLGEARLPPDIPNVWNPGQEMSIGNTIFRLVSPVQPRVEKRSSESRRPELSITPQQLTVEAGESVTATLSLGNPGPDADTFTLSVSGIPGDWVSGFSPRIELKPDARKEISVNVQVPRRPESRAGRHPITIKAINERDPRQSAEVKLTLTIAAYPLLEAQVQPQQLSEDQAGQVIISNLGNLQETLTVQFTDFMEELAFQPPQVQVSVPPGEVALLDFRAQLRRPRWFGPLKSHSFSVQVNPPTGRPEILNAEFVSRSLIPVWALPIALLLCLLFTGSAGALWYYSRDPLTPTPLATVTPAPGAPLLEALCIFPSDQRPATYLNCPSSLQVPPGKTVIIYWKVNNASRVNIEPLGERAAEGEDLYSVLDSKTITLKADHPIQPLEKSIHVVVISATLTSGPAASQTPVTNTATLQPTATIRPSTSQPASTSQLPTLALPTATPTPTNTNTPQPTATHTGTNTNTPSPPTPTQTHTPGQTLTPTLTPTATGTPGSASPSATTGAGSNSSMGGTGHTPHSSANTSIP